jgi:hypothetical protein
VRGFNPKAAVSLRFLSSTTVSSTVSGDGRAAFKPGIGMAIPFAENRE